MPDTLTVDTAPDATIGIGIGGGGVVGHSRLAPIGIGSDPVFLDDGGGPDSGSSRSPRRTTAPRNADVLGMPMWVAWLVGSAILGGLALHVAVRRVSLPTARDSS